VEGEGGTYTGGWQAPLPVRPIRFRGYDREPPVRADARRQPL